MLEKNGYLSGQFFVIMDCCGGAIIRCEFSKTQINTDNISKIGQVMGVKEYKFAGDDRHLLNEYHRQLDSLGEWQINFLPDTKHQTYAFDYIGSGILTVYNDYSLSELQALCGDFEHCVKADGSNLLELYDFVKGGKKNALDNKAFDYYNSEVKTLRQKAIDYYRLF